MENSILDLQNQMVVCDELNNAELSIPEQYTPLEYLNELWKRGLEEYIVPKGETSFGYLKILSLTGLNAKYDKITDEIAERWKYELDKISSCGVTAFYLILWDFIRYTKLNNLEVSPGCGAIPGSLVAYCLGITDVDPIKYNLIIDRFLSQTKGVPGCRIELEIGGSQRLTDYVIEKYGKGMMKLLEGLDITFHDIADVSIIKETLKSISDNTAQPVEALMINYDDEEVFNLINSGGIKDTELLRELNVDGVAKGIEAKSMEDLIARLSLDRLGLEERCSKYIKNKNNPDSIHYECPELETILASTYGYIVYQEQIMQILTALGGLSPEESNLVRRGMSKRDFIFNKTARHDFIKGNVEKGISGCVANGISETTAEKIFDNMWTAAIYGFNKAHAAAYATLTYRLAWLKHYYREEYIAAVEYVKTIQSQAGREE